jgi:hypothetical protein
VGLYVAVSQSVFGRALLSELPGISSPDFRIRISYVAAAADLPTSTGVTTTRSVYGSAVAVERTSSGGHDTISLRRASLQSGTIRMLMMVKQHLKLARVAMEKVL